MHLHIVPNPQSTNHVGRVTSWGLIWGRRTRPCALSIRMSSTGRLRRSRLHRLSPRGKSNDSKLCRRFYYEALPVERSSGATRLPWLKDAPAGTVGVYARDHGRTLPGRMIESAKSWLCHNGVDRRAALLPWHGAADVERLSPVEATARYIRHMKDAWDASHPGHPLAEQDVVLTIPASFDEVARELTVAAARAAGLPQNRIAGRTAGGVLFVGRCPPG